MNDFIETREINIKSIYNLIVENLSFVLKFTFVVAVSSIIISLILTPKYETNSVILPYKSNQQSAGIGGLLQSSLGVNLGTSEGMNYERIFDDLFNSNDFIQNILYEYVEKKDGENILLIDLILDNDIDDTLTKTQLSLLAKSSFINNHLSVNYDSYKSLVYIRVSFHDEILALNIHNLVLEEFDNYLSVLKNTKIEQKNLKLNQKLKAVDLELKDLEIKKENFITVNKNIIDSPFLTKELRVLEREISVKESIFLSLSSQIELNKVDLSLEKNNFRILNSPVLPLNPSFPKKKFIVIISTLMAFVISILFLLIRKGYYHE
tara:strand:- start:358 stop:1320 length:963 start_codon:yes stop_codon:yes gene_type:complete